MDDLGSREVGVLGSHAHDHPTTIEMVAGWSGRPRPFLTGRIALDDIVERIFRELVDDEEENVTILVQPR